MRMLRRVIARTEHLAPFSLALCLGVIVLDLLAFHALGRRPFISYAEVQVVAWAVLIACGWVFAARWLISGEKRSRFALAGALGVMVLLSVTHPYQSGTLRQTWTPQAEPVVSAPSGNAILEFRGGPLSSGREVSAA